MSISLKASIELDLFFEEVSFGNSLEMLTIVMRSSTICAGTTWGLARLQIAAENIDSVDFSIWYFAPG